MQTDQSLRIEIKIQPNVPWWALVSPILEKIAKCKTEFVLGREISKLPGWMVIDRPMPGETGYRPTFALGCGMTYFGSLFLLVDVNPETKQLGMVYLAAGQHVFPQPIYPWLPFRIIEVPSSEPRIEISNIRTSGWETTTSGPCDYTDNVLVASNLPGWLDHWMTTEPPALGEGRPLSNGEKFLLTSPAPRVVDRNTHIVAISYQRPQMMPWIVTKPSQPGGAEIRRRQSFHVDTATAQRWILRIEQ